MKNFLTKKSMSGHALQKSAAINLFVIFTIITFVSGCRFMDDLEDVLDDKEDKDKKVFTAEVDPLNNSGVSGHATLILEGKKLTVKIHAEGLEADSPHPQHIHGLEDNKDATCPTRSADENDDGLIEIGEGLPFYGPVLLPLEPFSTAADGTIDYEHTFMLGEGETIAERDLMPLQNRVIVLHGMTVDGEYMATLPVACGEIKEAGDDYNHEDGYSDGDDNGDDHENDEGY